MIKRERRFTSPTLIINSVAKPPSKPRSQGGDFSGSAPGTGLFTLDDQHAPVELLMTLANTVGSNPSRCPRSMASATTICSTPSIKLLHIFAARPDPAGPQWIMRWPMSASIGEERPNDCLLPPTRKDNVPALAPVTPEKICVNSIRPDFRSNHHRIYLQTRGHPPSLPPQSALLQRHYDRLARRGWSSQYRGYSTRLLATTNEASERYRLNPDRPGVHEAMKAAW